MKPSFEVWVTRFETDNSPVGDLARDILADNEFLVVNNYRNIHDYLIRQNACGGAVMAFEKVWGIYEQ